MSRKKSLLHCLEKPRRRYTICGTDQSRMLRPTLCLSVQLLEPLRLACGQTLPRLVEPALACLHKLVSQNTAFAKATL